MFNEIKKIIDDWDPSDLLSGTHPDVYHAEADIIEVLIIATQDVNILAKCIHQLFIKMFGANQFKCTIDDCMPIAERILAVTMLKGEL